MDQTLTMAWFENIRQSRDFQQKHICNHVWRTLFYPNIRKNSTPKSFYKSRLKIQKLPYCLLHLKYILYPHKQTQITKYSLLALFTDTGDVRMTCLKLGRDIHVLICDAHCDAPLFARGWRLLDALTLWLNLNATDAASLNSHPCKRCRLLWPGFGVWAQLGLLSSSNAPIAD